MSKKNLTIILFIFCAIKLVLHLVADFQSGFQGDELLHIQTGNHPDIGYMEFPPIIGWLAFLQNQLGSTAVVTHHLFSHIASLLIMITLALTVVELGGKTRAVVLVLICVLAAPAFGRSQQLFQPVVFSQLGWVLSFYQLVRFVKQPKERYLLYLTASILFGLLSKYDAVFFIGGLTGLLFFGRMRMALAGCGWWKYVLLAILLIAPNLWWQYKHDFPVLQMFSRLYEMQLDHLSIADVLKDMFIALNPFTIPIWIAGLVYLFSAADKKLYRPLGFTIVLSILFLAFSRSKAYYFFPVILTLLAAGSVWVEDITRGRRNWVFYPVAGILIITGLLMLPFSLAVLPLGRFISYARIKEEDGRKPVEFAEYYSHIQWPATMRALREVYDSLPDSEREETLIWGKHYRQAGAVNLYRKQFGLPPAFSYHGSFYLWAPLGPMPGTVIAFTNGEAGKDFFDNYFASVTAVKTVANPFAEEEKDARQTIYVCKSPRQDFNQMKELFEKRVFE